MKLTTQNLEEFKAIYKKHLWTDLSEQDALKYALDLLNLMKVTLPIKTNKQKN